MIQVRRTAEQDPLIFEVVVREGKGETRHQVTMSRDTCERLTSGKHTPERCLEAAFKFLLDREPKESILRHFDVTESRGISPSSSGRFHVTFRSPTDEHLCATYCRHQKYRLASHRICWRMNGSGSAPSKHLTRQFHPLRKKSPYEGDGPAGQARG